MTNQGYDDIEYEDGAQKTVIKISVSQNRYNAGDLMDISSYEYEDRVKFLARFVVNDEKRYVCRCIMARDGTLRFNGLDEAVAIVRTASHAEIERAFSKLYDSIVNVSKSAVPLQTGSD